MKVLPFENGVSEKLEDGDGSTQNISKVSWSAHNEFSNRDSPISLNVSTLSSRHDNLSAQTDDLCKKVRQGDIITCNKLRSRVQNKPKISKGTNTFIEPFCIPSKRKCQGN